MIKIIIILFLVIVCVSLIIMLLIMNRKMEEMEREIAKLNKQLEILLPYIN